MITTSFSSYDVDIFFFYCSCEKSESPFSCTRYNVIQCLFTIFFRIDIQVFMHKAFTIGVQMEFQDCLGRFFLASGDASVRRVLTNPGNATILHPLRRAKKFRLDNRYLEKVYAANMSTRIKYICRSSGNLYMAALCVHILYRCCNAYPSVRSFQFS